MLVPFSWLKEYVDIDCTPEELQEKLFSCGFEVEELNQVGKDISNVVVGLVESCEAVPDTHLHLCTVNCGAHGTFQIMCGADNVAAGKKFPAALVGATVYETNRERTETIGVATIKKGKLRGYTSEGMLCSGLEIGLSEDLYPGAGYNGLLILPDDAPAGADVKPIVGLDDWIFDISVTANRPDCQSIYGIAREAAAVLNKPVKPLDLSFQETDRELPGFQVTVDAPQYCRRYIAHYIYNLRTAPSPAWMRRRLALVGIRGISNIVDITNYIMLELGQPMHAYDLAQLEGNAIRVRCAGNGEKITTLDEQELTLSDTNLLICDGKKPIGLAGIMGGLNSEITDGTKEVVFEAAQFARDNIRRTSRSLGKRTDASAKFEKGTDEYTTVQAMKRALHLVRELGCAEISRTHFDVNTGNSIEKRLLTVSVKRVNGVLGITVPNEEILRILRNLDMEPQIAGDELTLHVPGYREDMESYQDVAEEVIRMYGYDHIVPTFLPSARVTSGGRNAKQLTEMKLKDVLCGAGMYECIHYSFFSPEDLDMMKYPADAPERRAIPILNPISEEVSIMRTTLAPSMIHAVQRNQKNGILAGRMYEIARIFVPKELPLKDYPDERDHLVIAFFGKDEDFYSLKGALDLAAETLKVSFTYEASEESFLHPYQSAAVLCGGKKIGYLGKLAYDIAEKLSLRTDLYVAEVDLQELYEMPVKTPVFEPLPEFPEVKRDLALIMDKSVTCAEVEDLIRSSNKHICGVELFDVYEGLPIPPDKKSMAFTVTFRPEDHEFTGEEIDRFVEKILKNLNRRMEITRRD